MALPASDRSAPRSRPDPRQTASRWTTVNQGFTLQARLILCRQPEKRPGRLPAGPGTGIPQVILGPGRRRRPVWQCHGVPVGLSCPTSFCKRGRRDGGCPALTSCAPSCQRAGVVRAARCGRVLTDVRAVVRLPKV